MYSVRCRAAEDGSWRAGSIELRPGSLSLTLEGSPSRSVPLVGIESVTEIAPFDEEPRCVELTLSSGALVVLEASSAAVDHLCEALSQALATQAEAAPVVATGSRRCLTRMRVVVPGSLLALLLTVGLVLAFDAGDQRIRWPSAAAATAPPSTSGEAVPSGTDEASATDEVARVVATAPTTTTPVRGAATAPEPRPSVIAPLTGLPVDPAAVLRSAIVAKIDASAPAMPQVGLEQADIVVEVQIESGLSRYLAVFHSRQPAVIGPHRSARTTDPDLLSLFGHALFAFSGANDGVVDRLAATTWKTGVGPGEVPQAWFRDESRPWPHNLFAWSEVLRSRPAPQVWPSPRFFYRPADAPSAGLPVGGMDVSVGATPSFRWDPALGGWRRWIHGREHLHADGTPVAPTNVVVVETRYGVSAADAASPEAVSVGLGRAWVLTDGRVVGGTWVRPDRFAPYDLRDGSGQPVMLLPGSTWIVLADREPEFLPAG